MPQGLALGQMRSIASQDEVTLLFPHHSSTAFVLRSGSDSQSLLIFAHDMMG